MTTEVWRGNGGVLQQCGFLREGGGLLTEHIFSYRGLKGLVFLMAPVKLKRDGIKALALYG